MMINFSMSRSPKFLHPAWTEISWDRHPWTEALLDDGDGLDGIPAGASTGRFWKRIFGSV